MAVTRNQSRRTLLLALVAGCVAVAIWLYVRRDGDGRTAAAPADEAAEPGPASEAEAPEGAMDRLLIAAGRPRRVLADDGEPREQVEGTARDASTRATIAGAEVVFAAPGGRRELTTTTGADGRYRIELPQGAWMVRAFGDRIVSMPTSVRIGANPGPVDLELIRAGRVRGVVRTVEGRPVAGAEVSVVHANRELNDALEATIGRTTVTDGNGGFAMDVLPGMVDLLAVSGTLTGAATARDLISGGDTDVTITVRAQIMVAGRVVDEHGLPVAGAKVVALAQFFEHGGRNRRTATTNRDGRFAFDQVDTGVLIVDAHTDAGAAAPITNLDLSQGAPRDLELRLAGGAHLSGRVVAGDGTAIVGAKLTATRLGTSWPFATVFSDRTGHFDIPAAPGDRFQLIASNDERIARVPDAEPGRELTLVLGDKGGIRGRVRVGERPLAGDVTVSIDRFVPVGSEAVWPRRMVQQLSTRDGTVSIPDLDPGKYDLTIQAQGLSPRAFVGVVVPSGGWADLDATLEAAAP